MEAPFRCPLLQLALRKANQPSTAPMTAPMLLDSQSLVEQERPSTGAMA